LGVLKQDRAELDALITSFNASTEQAGQGIDRLSMTADGAGRQIARHIESATSLKDDLVFLSDRGNQLADRLDGLVRSAQAIAPDPTVVLPVSVFEGPTFSGDAGNVRSLIAAHERLPEREAQVEDIAPRLRSQAERDLLKALRIAR
jgi:hypothetical protein